MKIVFYKHREKILFGRFEFQSDRIKVLSGTSDIALTFATSRHILAKVTTIDSLVKHCSWGAVADSRYPRPSSCSRLTSHELVAVPGMRRGVCTLSPCSRTQARHVGLVCIALMVKTRRRLLLLLDDTLWPVDNLTVAKINIINGVVRITEVQIVFNINIDFRLDWLLGFLRSVSSQTGSK